MVAIPRTMDPTLEASDRALEAKENRKSHRPYLGMSGVGRECERQIWKDFHWVSAKDFDASTLKKFADGHLVEDVQAGRLRMVDGVTLWTVDEQTGDQIRASDCAGHALGHADGVIVGLLQAPETPHVWEHKSVNEAKFKKLDKLKEELGEKNAFKEWDATYYAQGQLYMHYLGLKRHYLTVTTPGGREATSCRTDYHAEDALRLVAKLRRITFATNPPPRISESETFYLCRWCSHSDNCHSGARAERNCRTCLHSTPNESGGWSCTRWAKALSTDEQEDGCPVHLYIPDLVPGEVKDTGDDWVSYTLKDGVEWVDGEK